jgi:hypothetical protein
MRLETGNELAWLCGAWLSVALAGPTQCNFPDFSCLAGRCHRHTTTFSSEHREALPSMLELLP